VQFLLLVGTANAGVAGLKGVSAADQDHSPLSPPVDDHDKKFFGKDYPWDKRPKVDVFHFKHPYPVVQDSDDFDRDFVKDENSDNGSWHAQTEYDRLRHKLLKEKTDVAKALAAKKTAENELEAATKREKVQKEKKKKHEEEEVEKKKKKEGAVSGSTGKSDEKKKEKVKVKQEVPAAPKIPGGVTADGEVKVAVGDTQKAMDALDECKEQLKKARKALKDLMKELEEAKARQRETEAALDAAMERLNRLQAGEAAVKAAAEKERQEYLAAKAAYEKQQAIIAKMEADIKVSAAKVKAMRDAEDKNGGVYNSKKSAAAPHFVTQVFALMLAMLIVGNFQ